MCLEVGFDPTVWDVGICGVKVLYIAYCFCLHGDIRPGNKTSLVFLGALILFIFCIFSYDQ